MTDDPPPSLTGRAVVLALVIITIVMSLALPVREFVEQRSRAADLAERTAAAESRIAELTALEQRWEDPAFVAARARERLGMAKPGEIAYVASDAPPAKPAKAAQAAEGAWYLRLWNAITRRD